jgi:nitronate monooxygenase
VLKHSCGTQQVRLGGPAWRGSRASSTPDVRADREAIRISFCGIGWCVVSGSYILLDKFMKTKITEIFGIGAPIVLAPMGGVAGGALAAAVTDAGGLGIIGCGYADPKTGYGGDEWIHRQFDLAAHRRVGAGFITWSLAKRPNALDVALERNADPIFLSFGDARSLIPKIRKAQRKVVLQVSTLAEAREAIALRPDAIVAQGTEAGGHGKTRTLFTLLPAVVDLAGSVPVLAAGGISDGRGLAAARALGAEGVVVGTRFFASREALGNEALKNRIVAAGGDDTVRTRVFDLARGLDWPPEYTGRAIANRFSSTWHGREQELSKNASEVARAYEAARQEGDVETLALFAGEGIDLVRDTPSAGDIVKRMMSEAEALLARLGKAAPHGP